MLYFFKFEKFRLEMFKSNQKFKMSVRWSSFITPLYHTFSAKKFQNLSDWKC